MIIEKIYEMLEPKIKDTIAQAYKDGAEDTNRRLLEVYKYGQINGYAQALEDNGLIEVGDIDG